MIDIFKKSYSEQALLMATGVLRSFCSALEEQAELFPSKQYQMPDWPSDIPEVVDLMEAWTWGLYPKGTPKGTPPWKNKELQKKAKQFHVFYYGVFTGLAKHYFDGKPSDLENFLVKAVRGTKKRDLRPVMKRGPTDAKDYVKEFQAGLKHAEEFRELNSL